MGKVYITESKLKEIVAESVKKVLNEMDEGVIKNMFANTFNKDKRQQLAVAKQRAANAQKRLEELQYSEFTRLDGPDNVYVHTYRVYPKYRKEYKDACAVVAQLTGREPYYVETKMFPIKTIERDPEYDCY